MLSGRIENFAEYSQFETLDKFNNAIEMFLAEHKKDFTKGELIAFKRLVRYSAKFVGVANAKVGTLLKAINEKANGYGISRSTFERMLRKAKQLGILTVKNTVKAKGGKGHNVYVFNTIAVAKKRKLTHCDEAEKPCDSKNEQVKIERETSEFKTNNNKDINKRIATLDHTFTSDYVPNEFKDLVKCFFDDAKTIEEYWRMVKVVHYDYRTTIANDRLLNTSIDAFKQLISKLKKKYIHNPIAYFTGVLKKKVREAFMETVEEEIDQKEDRYKFPSTLPILF